MALALWFSATAVLPSLRAEFSFSDDHAALLSSSVAVGFVCGTLISDRTSWNRIGLIEVSKEDRNMTDNFEKKGC